MLIRAREDGRAKGKKAWQGTEGRLIMLFHIDRGALSPSFAVGTPRQSGATTTAESKQ
jgi:hypothetical protein